MSVDHLISPKQAAERLGVQRQTILKWCRQSKIAHHRIMSKRIVIPEREVERILRQGYVPAAAGDRAS